MTLLEHFKKLCSIPHPSGKEKEIIDYVESYAKENRLSVYRDKNNNLIITLPASNSSNTVMCQAHADMVFVADSNDMELINKPLELIEENGRLRAKGTSLGADDATGMAIMLKLIEDRPSPCPELQLIFTTEEETGLYGAKALDKSLLRSNMLINLDIDDEGIAITGSAGGRNIRLEKENKVNTIAKKAFRLKLQGLKGGHSGSEIHLDRYNALTLIGELIKKSGSEICSFKGGSFENVIPSSCEAVITCGDLRALQREIENLKNKYTKESFDISVEDAYTAKESGLGSFTDMLMELPCGVLGWEDDKSCVKTSANVANISIDEEKAVLLMSVRSSKDDEKEKLCEKVKDIAIKHGFTYSDSADYCGWAPKTGTKLQAAYAKSYKALTSKEPTFCPVHAGLECSIIGHSIKDFDAISIGPNTKGIHSTKEELDIQSFNRTYEVIKIMLGELS